MSTRKIACVALIAASSIALAACESSPADPPSATPTESQGTSSGSPTPTATQSPTPSETEKYEPATADGPAKNVPVPEMPALAKENSEEGAASFAEYFFDLINYTGESTDSAPIGKLSTEQCQECFESVIDPADHSKSIGEWQVGGDYKISLVDVYKSSKNRMLVTLKFTSEPFKTYMKPNVVVGEYSEVKSTIATLQLLFEGGWKVEKILIEEP